jgi:hypothetical protein
MFHVDIYSSLSYLYLCTENKPEGMSLGRSPIFSGITSVADVSQSQGYNYRDPGIWNEHEVRVRARVILRLEICRQSVRLGAGPLEARDQRFLGGE